MAKISTGFITEKINGIAVNTSYKCHSSNYTNATSRDVKYVIIHYTGNDKDKPINNCKYFQTGGRNASAHLFVGDNEIYQSVELRDSAWAIGCKTGYKTAARNSNSISIEMCTSGGGKCSKETQITTAYVAAYLCKKIGITADKVDKYVLRHYDCVASNKKCPLQYVNNPAEWISFKTMVKNILQTGSYVTVKATSTKVETKPTVAATKKSYTGKYPTIPARGYFAVGDKGTQVKYLQQLIAWITGKSCTVDGIYGKNTGSLALEAQKLIGTKADGKWGSGSNSAAKLYKK